MYFCLIVVVQSLSHVRLFAIPWTAAHQASMSLNFSWSLLRFMSVESVMLSISSSAALFSFCLPSFPACLFQCHLFASGGWSIGASALASVLPMNFRGWFPLGLTGLVSLQSKRLLRVPLSWTKRPWYVRNLCFCLVQKSNCKFSLHCVLILMTWCCKSLHQHCAISSGANSNATFPWTLSHISQGGGNLPCKVHTTFSAHIVVYHREPQYILPQAYYPSRLCTVQGGRSCNFS